MAEIDSRIHLMQEAPDVIGGLQKGMTMKQLAMKNQNDQQDRKISILAKLARNVTDQSSYDQARSMAPQYGIDPSDWPIGYDPNLVNHFKAMDISSEKQADLDARSLDREEQRKDRWAMLGYKTQEKKEEKADKKKAQMYEIEDRRQNINAAISQLDGMIKEDGTWEMFGSHNQDLERLVDQIATDMAKLQDPESVARPQEVESVKRNLVKSGFQNKNSTARDLLQNFKGEVERRANSAYKVRGIDLPSSAKSYDNMSDDELTALYNERIKGSKNANAR